MAPVPKPKRTRSKHFLKEWREYCGLTQEQALERLAWSQSKMSRIESGKTPYNQDDIEEAAQVYRCPVSALLTINPLRSDLSELPEAVNLTVPVLSMVSAGVLQDYSVSDDALSNIQVTDLPKGDWIALQVTGSSMDRISPPDSIILVNRSDKQLVPNGLYVIATEDGSATYKRYRPSPDRFEPVSTEQHETIFPEQEPTIIGRVRRTILDM